MPSFKFTIRIFFFYKFENLNFGPLSNITLFEPPCDTVQEKCSSHENAV